MGEEFQKDMPPKPGKKDSPGGRVEMRDRKLKELRQEFSGHGGPGSESQPQRQERADLHVMCDLYFFIETVVMDGRPYKQSFHLAPP